MAEVISIIALAEARLHLHTEALSVAKELGADRCLFGTAARATLWRNKVQRLRAFDKYVKMGYGNLEQSYEGQGVQVGYKRGFPLYVIVRTGKRLINMDGVLV